jgi:hypothetical protein
MRPAQSSPPQSGYIYSILFAMTSRSSCRFIQPVAAAAKEMWGTAKPGPAVTMCPQSQDVHTPRVIASHFVAGDAHGYIQPSSERRRPETLQVYAYMAQTFPVQSFMDEVDGRPGAVALQSGHLDAPLDVPMVSLSLPHSTPQSTVIPSTQLPRHYSGADQPKAACPTAGGGEHHENLPGK